MPLIVSDIHEISVMIGICGKSFTDQIVQEKFNIFCKFTQNYGIKITFENFKKYETLFDRGLKLGNLLKKKYDLKGQSLSWSAAENHKEDSSDIYVDGIGISLKDSSKIIRNSGFRQLIQTFHKNPRKTFTDPFWEFAPSLSVEYLRIVVSDCNSRKFFYIKNSEIYIGGKKRGDFFGNISDFLELSLKELILKINKSDIKNLVKDFSKNGCTSKLLYIRKKLTEDVSHKVVSYLKEGLIQDSNHFSEQVKYMLQYRDTHKLFGFSSSKAIYSGKIVTKDIVNIQPAGMIYTEPPQLTEKTTGLQINLYTPIKVKIFNTINFLKLQNQLRYKHRTFSCAPEGNFHLLDYSDWRKLYPDNI